MALVQFLRARLDEDEQIALSHRQWSPDWYFDDTAGEIRDSVNRGTVAFVPAELDATHIARHDPARALAEVEAKRRIIADYERYVAERRRAMGGWDSYPGESPILAALAAVYADHPDYRDDWRPST
ncbi:DUF6221 family protein [Streptomyces erythrochromogenes]|uniref:DUF6221 family protein n=1 Tax=Streptomyces erythrochromogenes TaxID=285574 RepID=UPI00342DE282